ncbi:MAG: ExbD/TolR family protein [Armatimonadota bacterium]
MSLSRSHKNIHAPRVEINIVPLVDVALVLLIIFMVTATFIKSAGMHIQLPTSSMAQAGTQVKKDLVIGVSRAGDFIWEGAAVSSGELAANLHSYAQKFGTSGRITLQGDERTAHGKVVEAMTIAQEAGFSRLMIAAKRDARKVGHAY